MASDTRSEERLREREAAARQRRVAEYDRYAAERDRWRAKNARLLSRHRAPGALRRAGGRERARDRLRHRRSARRAQADATASASTSRRGWSSERARASTRCIDFVVADAETLDAPELAGRTFDYVVLSDVVGQLYDVWSAFRALRRVVQSAHAHHRHLLQLRVGAAAQARRAARAEDAHRAAELARHAGPREPARAQPLRGHPLGHGAARARRRSASSRRSPIATSRKLPGLRHLALTQYFVCKLAGGGGPIPDARLLVHRRRARARTSAATSTTSSRARPRWAAAPS